MSRHLPEILRHLDIDICLSLMNIRTNPKWRLSGSCAHPRPRASPCALRALAPLCHAASVSFCQLGLTCVVCWTVLCALRVPRSVSSRVCPAPPLPGGF